MPLLSPAYTRLTACLKLRMRMEVRSHCPVRLMRVPLEPSNDHIQLQSVLQRG